MYSFKGLLRLPGYCMAVSKITPPFIHLVIHSFIPHNLWEFRAIWKTAAATAASTVQGIIQVSRQYSALSISLFFFPQPFYSPFYCGPCTYTRGAQSQGLLIVHINHYGPVSENNPLVQNTRVLLLLWCCALPHMPLHTFSTICHQCENIDIYR